MSDDIFNTPGDTRIPPVRGLDDARIDYVQLEDARTKTENDDWFGDLLGTPNEPPVEQQEQPQEDSQIVSEPEPIGHLEVSDDDDEGFIANIASQLMAGGGAAASDIAAGTVEAPRQAFGGMIDALGEIGQTFDDVLDLGGIQITDPETGELDFEFLSGEEFRETFGEDTFGILDPLRVDEPETVTGGFVRSTTQFLTAFIPAAKAAQGLRAGAVVTAAGAGVIADMVAFDPHEERLSTYLNQVPVLGNVVPDYLADHGPDAESRWEGRLKNAIEGAGLGLAADGLLRVFKYYKAARLDRKAAKIAATPEGQLAADTARDVVREKAASDMVEPISADQIVNLGDPEAPRFETRSPGVNELGEELPGQVYINHARIDSEDDVIALIQEMANQGKAGIDAVSPEKVSNRQTIKASSQHYQDITDLLGREPGPMTAAEAVAARKILTTSGEQVADLAKIASAPDASKADLYNLERAMSVHYAIQNQVIGARRETARALQSWAIPAGSDQARGQAIEELIAVNGGSGNIQKMAQAITSLSDNPTGLQVAINQLKQRKPSEAFYEYWINGLLSSPKTHMVNILSNALTTTYAIPERLMASGISKAFYQGEIDAGEVGAQAWGLVRGMRDGAILMAKGNRASGMADVADAFDAFVKTEGLYGQAIAGTTFGLDAGNPVAKAIDYAGMLLNIPTKALGVEDVFFKSANYRMELSARAYRQALSEGLEGDAFAKRVSDIMLNPPDDLKADAIDFAAMQTFTKQLGKTGRSFQQMVQKVPGAKFVAPFIRTPTNIMKYSFARTPLAYASSAIRADIRAGGARAAQAHARVATGSMMMLVAADLTNDGTITGAGPAEPRLRRIKMDEGWLPYSVKIGDQYFQYNRLDPIGMMVGMAADMAEMNMQLPYEDADRLAVAGAFAFAQNLASKTYMSGVYDFIGAIDPSNPTSDPAKYMTRMAGTLSPYSSFVRHIAGTQDPILRDTRTAEGDPDVQGNFGGLEDPVAVFLQQMVNEYRKNIPGLSDELPPRRDLWGDVITRTSGLGTAYDFLSPIASRAADPDPVDEMILKNGIKLSMPGRSIQGVRLTGEEYSRFVEMAGEPAKQTLDQMVSSGALNPLSDGPDGMKAQAIKNVINMHKQAARARMLQEFPDLRERVIQNQAARQSVLQGQ